MTDGVSYEGVFGAAGGRHRVASKAAVVNNRSSQLQSLGYLGAADRAAAPSANRALPLQSGESRIALQTEVFFDTCEVPLARPDDAREESSQERDVLKAVATRHPTLARALWDLPAKLTNGAYNNDGVKVVNYRVEVFIRLTNDSAANIEALKRLGVEVVSHTRAGKILYAKVNVKDLAKIADLLFVERIDPAKF